jgi:hypothetical protein
LTTREALERGEDRSAVVWPRRRGHTVSGPGRALREHATGEGVGLDLESVLMISAAERLPDVPDGKRSATTKLADVTDFVQE